MQTKAEVRYAQYDFDPGDASANDNNDIATEIEKKSNFLQFNFLLYNYKICKYIIRLVLKIVVKFDLDIFSKSLSL